MGLSQNTTNREKYDCLISEIIDNDKSDLTLRQKYINLKKILERSCKELTRSETLQFPSLFSRLVFIAQKYNLSKHLEWQLQNIRIKSVFLHKDEQHLISENQYKQAYNNICNFFSIVCREETTETLEEDISIINNLSVDDDDYIRIQLTNIDRDQEILIGICEKTLLPIRAKYNVKRVNDIFNSSIDKIWIGAQLNLIQNQIDNEGCYIPKYIVLEPDYLIDASAMAECFQNYGKSYLHYFRRKFEQPTNSQYILLGNLANFFLDELIYTENADEITFDDVFLKGFMQKPFEFTSCNEIKDVSDFRAFMVKSKVQFYNIKRVVTQDFKDNNIDINKCTLEPSFYCERFGFQGRLDLLQLSEKEGDTHKIVELKSGGLPYPKNDPAKIAINHEVQTAIYRLIIKSVFNCDDRKIVSAILYSASENQGENLRIAAPYQQLEKEIINTRNLIIATENEIYSKEIESVEKLFTDICNIDNYGRVPDFFTQQITSLDKAISKISSLERLYFYRYVSFVARELYIQKIGGNYFESNTSTASLWNTTFLEREESFDLIPNLEITNIDDTGRDMKIEFQRNDSSDFINFREGEICILYPRENDANSPLTNQILKGTIVEISKLHIILRFRYKQKHKDFFEKYKIWVVEHDRLDHSYNQMYKSLFAFITSPIDKRQLVLGLRKPKSENFTEAISVPTLDAIEDKQAIVLDKAIRAQDYFLIVGPPGTGKTSIFARKIIEHYYANTEDNILIISYTNRAVDELCEAINQAFDCDDHSCDKFIRIGTELSCDENYRHRLLQNISQTVKSRDELRVILHQKRIFIGTLASIVGRPEIFDLKKFDLAIIDEASQILEPQIVGILPKVDKFIMIGDHKQLSTITLQDADKSKTEGELYDTIKLYNCNESLFERLFRICEYNNWTDSYETLTYQGRMHNKLAEFPNHYFYNNVLLPTNDWQSDILDRRIPDQTSSYQQVIAEKRLHFIDCSNADNQQQNDKVNYAEANEVVAFTKAILEVYKANGISFDKEKTLGIITPYRNQIALIKHKLQETGIAELQNIMIDTVERFQGSQRDIIILSFCLNKPYQLDFFSNLNADRTVDRKLNVAITRARQQLIVLGNKYILSQNPIYRSFLTLFD